MQFADRLKALRDKAGLSQAELADRTAIPLWSIRNWEQGRRVPDWGPLFCLVSALGVKADDLADCVFSPPPKKTAKGGRSK